MIANKIYKNIILSLLLTAIYTALLFFFFYPSSGELGESFSVAIMYMITEYAALGCGVLLMILRLVKIIKDPVTLIYVFLSILNIALGCIAIVLYISNHAILSWLHESLLNLLIGVLMLGDSLIFGEIK